MFCDELEDVQEVLYISGQRRFWEVFGGRDWEFAIELKLECLLLNSKMISIQVVV